MLCVFCKQKTAYEMRISDWSSDVCSSDLLMSMEVSRPGCVIIIGMTTCKRDRRSRTMALELDRWATLAKAHWAEHQPRRYRRLMKAGTLDEEIGRASCRERVCQSV